MEKSDTVIYELPAPNSRPPPQRNPLRHIRYLAVVVILAFGVYSHVNSFLQNKSPTYDLSKSQCEQPDPLFPSSGDDRLEDSFKYLSTPEFKESSIDRLSKAVQIPTESFDNMGPVGKDPRWDVMFQFSQYLRETFPHVHEFLELVNDKTHG